MRNAQKGAASPFRSLRFRDDETAPRKSGYLPILLLLAGLLLAGLL